MLIEAFVGLLVGLLTFVAGLVPSSNPPGWLTGASGDISTLVGYVNGVGAWFPLSLAATVIKLILASAVIGFVVKIIRLVVSLFTGGGGSAA